jgi:hypothetical protein
MGASGNVGKFVVAELIQKADLSLKIVKFTRTPLSEEEDPRVQSLYCDMQDSASIKEALGKCRLKVLFVAMPQALTSQQMKVCGMALVEAFAAGPPGLKVVRLSSLCIEPSDTFPDGQGPLGAAHVAIEQAMLACKQLDRIVSIRPVSFFTNIAYDLPALSKEAVAAAGGECVINSMLGRDASARVNWVACEDIGAVAAHHMLLCGNGEDKTDSSEKVMKVDVTGGAANSLTLQEYLDVLSAACREVYRDPAIVVTASDLPLPEHEDYAALWRFLRKGGFDQATADTTVKRITGREPRRLVDHVKETLLLPL